MSPLSSSSDPRKTRRGIGAIAKTETVSKGVSKDEVKARFFDKVARAKAGSVDPGEWEDLGALLDFLVAQA